MLWLRDSNKLGGPYSTLDQSIKEILSGFGKHSLESDKARAAILKNSANCYHDQSKIKTLGPFAYLLFCSLYWPPTENKKNTTKLCSGKSGSYKTMKLFRGLGLPKSAIEIYSKMKDSEERFEFNGFISTSVFKSVAKKFALAAAKKGG